MPPEIDETKCIKCGACVDVCTEDVYFGSRKKKIPSIAYADFCFHCNCCVEHCPSKALSLRIPLPLLLLFRGADRASGEAPFDGQPGRGIPVESKKPSMARRNRRLPDET